MLGKSLDGHVIVFSTIERLVDNFGFIRKGTSNIFTGLFGSVNQKSKDYNNILGRCIFMFVNQV